MKTDLYGSVVSKLASVVPLFAKSIVDAALERNGLTPSTVTPVQMMHIIRDEIQPRIRKFALQDDEVISLGVGHVETDALGAVVRMDPIARRLLGLPPHIPTDDPALVTCIKEIILPLEDESCRRPRVREFHHEPSQRVLNVAVVPRHDREGEPSGCFAIIQDVTLRVALEQEVLCYEEELRGANQELERKHRQLEIANRHKDDFLARMSHELRTPLHCIIGYTQLALKREGDLEEAETRQNLRTTMACAHDLLGLINDVFDLSKVESGTLGVRPELVDLRVLVNECIETTRPLICVKEIRLVADLPDDGIELRTDPLRLKQILLNLLGNAVKFTDGGEVRVEVNPPENGRILLHVCDTGIGIEKVEQERIFERFYQVDGSTTRRHGGAGLGLALVRHLVRILGGDVHVRSEPGKGSRFTVQLPVG